MEDNKTWDALEAAYPNIEGEYRPISLNEYQERAMSTCMASCDNFSYMAFGLIAEVGEIADKVAKAVRKDKARVTDNLLFMDEETRAGIVAELGDVLWFVAGMASYLKMPLDKVAINNLDKLSKRKESNTIVTHTDH